MFSPYPRISWNICYLFALQFSCNFLLCTRSFIRKSVSIPLYLPSPWITHWGDHLSQWIIIISIRFLYVRSSYWFLRLVWLSPLMFVLAICFLTFLYINTLLHFYVSNLLHLYLYVCSWYFILNVSITWYFLLNMCQLKTPGSYKGSTHFSS